MHFVHRCSPEAGRPCVVPKIKRPIASSPPPSSAHHWPAASSQPLGRGCVTLCARPPTATTATTALGRISETCVIYSRRWASPRLLLEIGGSSMEPSLLLPRYTMVPCLTGPGPAVLRIRRADLACWWKTEHPPSSGFETLACTLQRVKTCQDDGALAKPRWG